MKSNKELWDEASVAEPIFYGENHKYFIKYGCKLEYYDDGSIRILNTRIGGDFYFEVKDHSRFLEVGFSLAAVEMAIETMKKQLEHVKSFKTNSASLKTRIKELENKIEEYDCIRQKNIITEEAV